MSRQVIIKGRNQLRTAVSGGFVLLMVLIYLAGAIQFNAIHAALHASAQEELHSPENEKEACHKAIYHQAQEDKGGCDHKTHLLANDSCSLCHLMVPVADSFTGVFSSDHQQHHSRVPLISYSCSYQEVISLLPSRAPPVC